MSEDGVLAEYLHSYSTRSEQSMGEDNKKPDRVNPLK